MSFDVAVLGGGVVGALSAYELAKAGAKTVLIDPRAFGSGASGRSAAMLELQLDAYRGDPFLNIARASDVLFEGLHAEMKTATGIDFHLERRGILQAAFTADETGALIAESDRQNSVGLKARWLVADELHREFPGLSRAVLGGILYVNDGQVSGNELLRAALAAAKSKGVAFRENVGETSLEVVDGRVAGVRTPREQIKADKIVVAAGAWTEALIQPLGHKIGIEPVRGQLLVYDSPEPIAPCPVYTQRNGYVVPKRDGTLLVGTTVERAGFDESTTEDGRRRIIAFGEGLFPSLHSRTIRAATSGLRPGSPDGLPFLGPLPDHSNVIVAAGHYRNGILLAPITARVVAALGTNRPSPIDLAPVAPLRLSLAAPRP